MGSVYDLLTVGFFNIFLMLWLAVLVLPWIFFATIGLSLLTYSIYFVARKAFEFIIHPIPFHKGPMTS